MEFGGSQNPEGQRGRGLVPQLNLHENKSTISDISSASHAIQNKKGAKGTIPIPIEPYQPQLDQNPQRKNGKPANFQESKFDKEGQSRALQQDPSQKSDISIPLSQQPLLDKRGNNPPQNPPQTGQD